MDRLAGGEGDRSLKDVVVVSYGGGTDSTAAILMMMAKREPPPRAILTADTGGEKPSTYSYISLFSNFIQHYGWPPIQIVKRTRRDKTWKSLEQDCLDRNYLPSVAYGWKTCSLKYKVEPLDKWVNNDPVCKAARKNGQKITRVIGYNFDETKRARFGEDDKYKFRYPLIEWEIGKEACKAIIQRVGLPLPCKSACFFCPHTKKAEIVKLATDYPDLARRALEIEKRGLSRPTKVKGLGRRFAWADVLKDHNFAVDEDPFDEEPCGCYDG